MKHQNVLTGASFGLFIASTFIAIARWLHPATFTYAAAILTLALAFASAAIVLAIKKT